MPTKRTRAPRHARQRVTAAAVEHYRAALLLRDRYVRCIELDRDCRRSIGGGHCADCLQYLQHWRALYAELRLKPWDRDPMENDELLKELENAE